MGRPLLLDLFCGAGGAATGYHQAGFDVVGVDIVPQKRFPFQFVHADALEFLATEDLSQFAAIHASPPCQAYSVTRFLNQWRRPVKLIEPVREALKKARRPYVIENVEGAPLIYPYILCGLTFGLSVKRHRAFETPVKMKPPPCPPGHPGDWLLIYGGTVAKRGTSGRSRGDYLSMEEGRKAMGIDWMTRVELSQAIPPAYTKFIGEHLMIRLTGRKGT